jgi:hypothetical protein
MQCDPHSPVQCTLTHPIRELDSGLRYFRVKIFLLSSFNDRVESANMKTIGFNKKTESRHFLVLVWGSVGHNICAIDKIFVQSRPFEAEFIGKISAASILKAANQTWGAMF